MLSHCISSLLPLKDHSNNGKLHDFNAAIFNVLYAVSVDWVLETPDGIAIKLSISFVFLYFCCSDQMCNPAQGQVGTCHIAEPRSFSFAFHWPYVGNNGGIGWLEWRFAMFSAPFPLAKVLVGQNKFPMDSFENHRECYIESVWWEAFTTNLDYYNCI